MSRDKVSPEVKAWIEALENYGKIYSQTLVPHHPIPTSCAHQSVLYICDS